VLAQQDHAPHHKHKHNLKHNLKQTHKHTQNNTHTAHTASKLKKEKSHTLTASTCAQYTATLVDRSFLHSPLIDLSILGYNPYTSSHLVVCSCAHHTPESSG
jgi:hypothetical protein